MPTCPVCGHELEPAVRGRPRRYCSRACQAKAYRARSRPGGGAPGAGAAAAGAEHAGAHLSPERIVRAAIAVADRDGLDALHMRTLAAELGAGTMSLYRHVPGREALIDRMVERVLEDHPMPDPVPPGWRAGLEHTARRDWAMYARHPWILQHALVGSRMRWNRATARDAEACLAVFDGLDLEPAERLRLLLVVTGYTQGLAMVAVSEAETVRRTGVTADRWRREQRPRVERELAAGSYPRLAALVEVSSRRAPHDLDELFEAGLVTVLDGIAARLADPGRPPAGPGRPGPAGG